MWVKKTFRAGCTKDQCKCSEAMWVRVNSIKKDGTLIGQLHNAPVCYPRKWGARVEVKPDEIISITVGETETSDEGAKLFMPQGTLPRSPRPYQPASRHVNWANMAAAVLAGVTLATLISSYARNA